MAADLAATSTRPPSPLPELPHSFDEGVEKRSASAGPLCHASVSNELRVDIQRALPMCHSRSRFLVLLQQRWETEGVTQAGHFCGTTGMLAIPFLFGRWPQHMWLVYLCGCCVAVPAWYSNSGRIRLGHAFFADASYAMSALSMVYFITTLLGILGQGARRWAFRWFFMTALGLQGCSALLERSAWVLHSLDRTAIAFIHIAPALVCYVLRWPNELGVDVEEAWPLRFELEQTMGEDTSANLLLAGSMPYFAWWLPYTAWVLFNGPSSSAEAARGSPPGAATGGGHIAAPTAHIGIGGDRARAARYMSCHGAFTLASYLWALLCWRLLWLHTVWILLLVVTCVWNGADYFLKGILTEFGPILRDRDSETQARRHGMDVELTSRAAGRCGGRPSGRPGVAEQVSRTAAATTATEP